MKKVLFVNPPMLFNSVKSRVYGNAPIRPNVCLPALLILGELKKAGFDTHFIDMAAEGFDSVSKVREGVYRFGLAKEALVSELEKRMPEAVLVESMFATNLEMVEEVSRTVKKVFPEVPVVVGGSFASEKPEWHLSDCVDIVVVGEGEKIIARILAELGKTNPVSEGIPGIFFKADGAAKSTVGINRSPVYEPVFDYDAVLLKEDGRYRYPERITRKDALYSCGVRAGEKACVFYGSRGCPVGCDYCSSWSREGILIRHMGGQRLFEQVRFVHEKYGVNVFYNQADTFGLHPEDRKFLELMKGYRKKFPEIVLNNPNAFFVRIFFKNGILDKGFVRLLKEAGFNVITLAVETFNQRFSKKIDFSEIPFEKIIELCGFIKSEKMKTDVYMMYGFPDETTQELENDLEKADELKRTVDEVSWGNLVIFPGSPYYERGIREKWFTEEQYRNELKNGYSYGKINDALNFSRIPTQKLRELFENDCDSRLYEKC